MSRLGIFVDRKTLSSAEQLNALIRCRDTAEEMGHGAEFIFPVDIRKIPQMDGLFIRARTDPMNVTYVASRMASFAGIPVIDDPSSIQICSDKVNMYSCLMQHGVKIPRTIFVSQRAFSPERAREIFEDLGSPLIVKEPSTSFSLRVEKVTDPAGLVQVARRYFKMSDWIVAQEFVESTYDWRVGGPGRKIPVCLQVHHPLADLQDPGLGQRSYRVLRGAERSAGLGPRRCARTRRCGREGHRKGAVRR